MRRKNEPSRMFVETFHVVGRDDKELKPGEITFGIGAPLPKWAKTSLTCPFCSGQLERAENAAAMKIHRVARVLGDLRDGQIPFLGSLFPARTHVFVGCRPCRIGFSVLKSATAAGAVDPVDGRVAK